MYERKQAGYTLIELVVVLAIASILTVIALSSIGTRNDLARFGVAVEDIKGAIHDAMNQAAAGKADGIAAGQVFFANRLTFNSTSYTLARTSDSSTWVTVSTVNLPDGLSLTPVPTQFVFTAPNQRYPSVAAYTTSFPNTQSYDPTNQSQRQTVTLTLTSRNNHRATITFDAYGGRLSSTIQQ